MLFYKSHNSVYSTRALFLSYMNSLIVIFSKTRHDIKWQNEVILRHVWSYYLTIISPHHHITSPSYHLTIILPHHHIISPSYHLTIIFPHHQHLTTTMVVPVTSPQLWQGSSLHHNHGSTRHLATTMAVIVTPPQPLQWSALYHRHGSDRYYTATMAVIVSTTIAVPVISR